MTSAAKAALNQCFGEWVRSDFSTTVSEFGLANTAANEFAATKGTKSACADSPPQPTQVGFAHFVAAVSTAVYLVSEFTEYGCAAPCGTGASDGGSN